LVIFIIMKHQAWLCPYILENEPSGGHDAFS